jgi:hypothetical protein
LQYNILLVSDIAINILLSGDIAIQFIDGLRYCHNYIVGLRYCNTIYWWWQILLNILMAEDIANAVLILVAGVAINIILQILQYNILLVANIAINILMDEYNISYFTIWSKPKPPIQ